MLLVDYIAESFRIVKETDPDAITVLNEYRVLVNERTRRAFISRARQLIGDGVPIDNNRSRSTYLHRSRSIKPAAITGKYLSCYR